jgi:phospholipase A1
MTNFKHVLLMLFITHVRLLCFAEQTSVKNNEQSVKKKPEEQLLKYSEIEKRQNLRIQYYKPIYFIYGEPEAKVQFSFRAPLVDDVPLNFAYSQTIFWDLKEKSKPFSDATYNPEFFYRKSADSENLQSYDIGIWEHNSNGKAGAESRSYNQSYMRLNYLFEGRKWLTQISIKLRVLYGIEKTSDDIRKYTGPFDLQVKFIKILDHWLNSSEVLFGFNPGGTFSQQWDRGGYQIGASFRVGRLKIMPAVYVQYYRGYSESLINYDKSVDEIRAGFLF